MALLAAIARLCRMRQVAGPLPVAVRHIPLLAERAEAALAGVLAGVSDRLPLLVPVGVALGIAIWFTGARATLLPLVLLLIGLVLAALALPRGGLVRLLLLGAAGTIGMGWLAADHRSVRVSADPLAQRWTGSFHARVDGVEPMPARAITRLRLATGGQRGLPAVVRVNVADQWLAKPPPVGSVIRIRARLSPPSGRAVPGGYDFARRAWFDGLGATGSALEPPVLVRAAPPGVGAWFNMDAVRAGLSAHIRAALPGGEGGIAVALVTGDTGGIADADAEAMRTSGLAHLLSISGLHVTAVVGAVFLLVMRTAGLVPGLALRVRLPLLAAGAAALVALAYTIISGGEVPTVRSLIAALIVLAALALGRDPISLRLVAAGALFSLLVWPEALVGPSFQLSFAAVSVIVALYESPALRRWVDGREHGWLGRAGVSVGGLLLTGLAIEAALIPIAAHHFHKAGIYGAAANLVAIPLTTFVIMPAEALALLFDLLGLGAPFWWVAGQGLGLVLALAHWVAAQPHALVAIPAGSDAAFFAYAAGLAGIIILPGRARMVAAVLALAAAAVQLSARPADLVVTADGRQMLALDEGGRAYLLRGSGGGYAASIMGESVGNRAVPAALAAMPGTRCSTETCVSLLQRGGRTWVVLAIRSPLWTDYDALIAACRASDIVVSDRRLPSACRPRWIKLDRQELSRAGGAAIRLDPPGVTRTRDPDRPMPWGPWSD